MIKKFLGVTAIVEALTGVGLLLIPLKLISFLFGSEFSGSNATMVTMIAGGAIFSISLFAWYFRDGAGSRTAMKILLFYNVLLMALFLFGAVNLGLKGTGLWLVVGFHFLQSVIGLVIMSSLKQ